MPKEADVRELTFVKKRRVEWRSVPEPQLAGATLHVGISHPRTHLPQVIELWQEARLIP